MVIIRTNGPASTLLTHTTFSAAFFGHILNYGGDRKEAKQAFLERYVLKRDFHKL